MQVQNVDDRQPLLSMMVKPRETFRYAIQDKTFSLSLYIGAFGGFSNALLGYLQVEYPKGISLAEIVYSAFITGVITYLLTSFIMGYLLKVIGKIFGSQATFKEIFQTLCLITIPYIWLLPILLFWMQLSPTTYFKTNFAQLEMGEVLVLAFGSFAVLIASIWGFVITLVGLSEVMKVSKWKAFWAMFITTIIVGIVGSVFYLV